MLALTHSVSFSFFFQRTADVWPIVSVMYFDGLFGQLPACWSLANVISIPKDPLSSSVVNYRPISLTPRLSTAFERQVSVRLDGLFKSQVFPTNQFVY